MIRKSEMEQLTDHPQLIQSRGQRSRLMEDRYYPLFHFGAPEGKLNDPNGLCYWQGNWHLFYQAFPTDGSPICWGHAVSEDLIHWKDLPYAICPGPEQACWSGATLVENDRVIAIYHGNEYGNMVAVSDDPLLLDWEKLTGKAVIPISSPDGSPLPYAVFDPCIWKQGEWYYSLSGRYLEHPVTQRQIRNEYLFRSKDLINWEYRHPLYDRDFESIPGMDGACPYFWPLGENHERDLLLHFSHLNGGKYLVGIFREDQEKFEVCNAGSFNSGSWFAGGVSAPSATPDGKGGVISIFTVNRARDGGEWDQIMSMPRRLTLSGTNKDSLAMAPAGDYESLRREHCHLDTIPLQANDEVVLEEIKGNAMELEIEIASDHVPVVEIDLLRSPDKEEYTRLTFYKQRGNLNYEWLGQLGWHGSHDSYVVLDATNGSLSPDVLTRAPEIASLFVAPDETLKLHIFIDRSIVEVFVNDTVCLSTRVFPNRNDSLGVSFRSIGKNSQILSLDAWQMGSIYDSND